MTKHAQTWQPMRSCTLEEFDELAVFVDTAFGKQDADWFRTYRPQIFRTTPESVACHRIVRDKNGIAGCIGVYPMVFRVGRAKLRVGGVGSVSTRADLRGGGLMSHMLRDTIGALERGGFDISWLGGARFRYGNYGWDHGGRGITFTVCAANIPRYLGDTPKVTLHTPRAADIETLNRAYRGLGRGAVRSHEMWELLLGHAEYHWEMAELHGRHAYIACSRHNPEHVTELAGAPDTAAALLLAHSRKHERGWPRVEMPDVPIALVHKLFRISESFSLHHNNQYRIVDIDSAWKKLVPEIALHGMAAGVTRASSQLATVRTERDREAVLHRALGFLDTTPQLPARLEHLEWVRPLGWWLSHVDGV